MILEEETYKKFGYYPRDSSHGSHKRVLAACDDCGKIREINKGDYRNFCNKCKNKGEKCHNYGKHLSEETRRKLSDAQRGEKHHNYGKHLSEETRRKMRDAKKRNPPSEGVLRDRSERMKGEKNPNWKGGLVQRKCQECDKTFFAKRYLLKKGYGLYCSKSCSERAKMRNRKFPTHHTKPERIFESICENNNLPFHYVGDGQLWIGRKGKKQLNPDFIEANGKKICIEIMGDYWHSPLKNRNLRESALLDYRKKHYKHYKWQSIFIWETDLLREDAEKFVLHLLEKG
jgi:hypothetical protein